MFRENQQIGIYTLIKRIGRGGFGEVWLAERRAKFVTTKVAVKLPLDEQVDHEAIKSEAVLWEQASGHPNVVPIIDADEYDGQIVIVSEYAPDGALDTLLEKEGALPIRKAVELSIGILSGLEFLHSKNIIHRDIKPANILLQGETPRLADFGISRVMKTTNVSVNLSGTPHYMAPETFDRKRTAQTDIWSVGVILYQMLKGSLPFPYNEMTDLLGAIIMRQPEPLPDGIPPLLQEIVLKSLAKKSDERYQTAQAMRDDLADFLIRDSQSNIQPRIQETAKIEKKTELLSTIPITEIQSIPTMRSPAFVANISEQTIVKTQSANENLELPFIESYNPKPKFSYSIILISFALISLLAIGGVYFFTQNQNISLPGRSETDLINIPKNLKNSSSLGDIISDENVCILSLTKNQDILFHEKKLTKDELQDKIRLCIEGKTPDKQKVYLNADADADYQNILSILSIIRKVDIDKIELLVSQTDKNEPKRFFEIRIPAEPKDSDTSTSLKPNPLSIVVTLNTDGKIQLNKYSQDSLESLKSRLEEIFKERSADGTFREGTNEVEKTVFVKAPRSAKYSEVAKVIDAVKGAGATPVGLQIDDLN